MFKLKINVVISFLFLFHCSTVKKIAVNVDVSRHLNQSEIFSDQFTGFSLFDIEKNKFVVSHNSTLKFIPASNTKLLTMYAVLKTFSDSIPSFLYREEGSVLFVHPIGDPTFLYEPFKNQKTFELLNAFDSLYISWPKEELAMYGAGWAWDDYIFDFQRQRSWWPIYGNTINIKKTGDSLVVMPSFFEDYVDVMDGTRSGELVTKEWKFNVFKTYIGSDTMDFERIIPFEFSKVLLSRLLSDTLKKVEVRFANEVPIYQDTLFSHSTDRVISYMLKHSDNFIAEQLLIMAAWKNGFSEINTFIAQIKNTWLLDLTDMIWVDGSGLSRYNLISPVDQVRLLEKCYNEFGWERMTAILPIGEEDMLRKPYLDESEEVNHLFTKTGTLSNNHNLSGYLVTRSGKRMIFSFMNNHYTRPTEEIKEAMEQLIVEIKNAY